MWVHIIIIPSHPVFALTPEYCVHSREAANTNCIAFGLTSPGIEPMIYRTRVEHAKYYTTDVDFSLNLLLQIACRIKTEEK